jgi:guanylate kinase
MLFNGIILLAGGRGAGKSTIAKVLSDKYGLKILPSHTTRKPRTQNESGHIFDTDEEFDKIQKCDMVAYSEHYGDRYCATKEQVEDNDIYIIDFDGIKEFKELYNGNKKVYTMYLTVSDNERKERLCKRGDSSDKIKDYLEKDRNADTIIINSGYIDLAISNDNDLGDTIRAIEVHVLGLQPESSHRVKRSLKSIELYRKQKHNDSFDALYEEDLQCIEEALKFYDKYKNIVRGVINEY